MKKIRLLAILFFLIATSTYFLKAQTVFAPVKGAKWTHIYRSFNFQLNGTQTKSNGIIKALYLKDTVIDGKDYKLITLNYEVLDSSSFPVIVNNMVIRYDSEIRINRYTNKFFVRQTQDTIWGAINQIDRELPYFIFRKSAPDSFSIKSLIYSNPVSKKVFIDSIKTIRILNQNLKIWKGKSYQQRFADGYAYDTCALSFAERIGPIDDLMPYFGFAGHPGSIDKKSKYGLVCYEDTEVGLLKFMDLDCDISIKTALKDISQYPEIVSYFDNSTHRISVNSTDTNLENWSLSLINLTGQIILKTPLIEGQNNLNVPKDLPTGAYFIQFFNKENKFMKVEKIFLY